MPYARQEDRRAQKARWKAANPERYKECAKAYAQKWRERNPGYWVKWKASNLEKIAAYRQKARQGEYRKFTKLGLTLAAARLLLARRDVCAMCGDYPKEFHLDHIIPRSRGGSSRPENLQWLCVPCNTAKGALTTEEFLAHIQKILAFRG